MTEINYTHAFEDLDSSLVYGVWYDERYEKAYVSLDEQVYQYDRVPFADVETLVQSNSIGRAFNGSFMQRGFKQKFGPGTRLGYLSDLTLREREAALATGGRIPANAASGLVGKNLTYSPNAVVDGTKASSESHDVFTVANDKHNSPSPYVNLRPGNDTSISAPKGTYTVHFESNGSRTYTLEADSVEGAVKALGEVADMLGVRAKVTGVFVHLV